MVMIGGAMLIAAIVAVLFFVIGIVVGCTARDVIIPVVERIVASKVRELTEVKHAERDRQNENEGIIVPEEDVSSEVTMTDILLKQIEEQRRSKDSTPKFVAMAGPFGGIERMRRVVEEE